MGAPILRTDTPPNGRYEPKALRAVAPAAQAPVRRTTEHEVGAPHDGRVVGVGVQDDEDPVVGGEVDAVDLRQTPRLVHPRRAPERPVLNVAVLHRPPAEHVRIGQIHSAEGHVVVVVADAPLADLQEILVHRPWSRCLGNVVEAAQDHRKGDPRADVGRQQLPFRRLGNQNLTRVV